MLNNNFVKKKLNNNEICLGIWSIINSNSNLDIFSKCKIDFILLDMEHGNYFDNIENSIRTIENNNVSPIIRIPNYHLLKKSHPSSNIGSELKKNGK